MRIKLWPFLAGGLLALCACSSSNNASSAPTASRTIATAPPAQTAIIAARTPGAPALATPAPAPADVTRLTEQVRLKITELPQGFSFGQFAGYQANEAAVTGFDDPQGVFNRMNSTGRLGGYVQSLVAPDSSGASYTIDVWKETAGATSYFDQYPRPDKSLTYQAIDLPRPLGDQSLAYQYQANGQTGYAVAWRRGRLILGAGELFMPGKESIDKLMPLITALDQKAQAAQQ